MSAKNYSNATKVFQSSKEKLASMITYISEIPLYYDYFPKKEEYYFSFLIDDSGSHVPKKFIYCHRKIGGDIISQGICTLEEINEKRNELIRFGWKMRPRPKIKVKGGEKAMKKAGIRLK